MSPATSDPDPPVHVELELVRAEQADDAFAFRFARQTYLVRGRKGGYETAELPWSRELLRDLEEIRTPDRDAATVARIGALLRELLDDAGWPGHEDTIVEARASRRRVHLTIRSAAAELYALPWELLALRSDGQHLGALEHVLLRYAWPGTSTLAEAPTSAGTPGRVLLAWSAAGGGVPAAEHTRAIQDAAEAAGQGDAVEVLPNASYGAIADALDAAEAAGRPIRALHLLCHGAETGSTFGIALDAEDDSRPAVVDGARLQQLLAPHADTLRLVVLSACDGGNMGQPGNRIGSMAQRLHRAGLCYVVASRYPLSTRGSTRIADALYEALWAGASIEEAFIDARSAASREVSRLDWASLQLYARPEDGDRGRVLAKPEVIPEPKPAEAPTPVVEATRVDPPPAPPPAPSPSRWAWLGKAVGVVLLLGIAFLVFLYILGSQELDEDPSAPAAKSEAKGSAPGDSNASPVGQAPGAPSPVDAPNPERPDAKEGEAPPAGGALVACTPSARDCRDGFKCVPHGLEWSEHHCVPVVKDAMAPGQPCEMQYSSTSGIDDCDAASICWVTDEDTLVGRCFALCTGSANNPTCADPTATCEPDDAGVGVCHPPCSPLDQDCPAGQGCYEAWNDRFICGVLDDSRPAGEPCEQSYECAAGTVCIDGPDVPGCTEEGCCSTLCELGSREPGCLPTQSCVPWFDAGEAPRGQQNVGICSVN